MNNENQETPHKKSHLHKIRQEMMLQNNNDYLNNTYPQEGEKVYKAENLVNDNNQNTNDRNNKFREPVYKDININTNNNINYNTDIISQQQQQMINNILFKKTKSGGAIEDNDIQTVEPQKPKKRRPVYKIPPSKKRAVSQGRSLIFIHKYYDENFILEEDNEDNASDSENKMKRRNKLKNIFREVTNIKRLIPQWHNEVCAKITPNVQNNNVNNDNLDKQNKDNNIENPDNVMRLSHMRFSLQTTNNNKLELDENNKDNNKDNNKVNNIDNNQENNQENKQENKQENNIDKNKDNNINTENNISQNEKVDDNEFKVENNIDNEEEKIYCSIELNPQIPANDSLTQSNISNNDEVLDSNLSGPRNSDSVIGSKTPINKSNLENKLSDELKQNPIKIQDINSPTYTESLIRDSTTVTASSVNTNIKGAKENNKKEELINSNNTIEEKNDINKNVNINAENEKKGNEDERISLKIPEYDLDKYFTKEGKNKRSGELSEVSTSLKTINLEENRNSQIIVDNLEEDQKKSLKSPQSLRNSSQSNKLENSYDSNNVSRGNSKDGSTLLTLDDAITGSVHIQENVQDFVKKNNELYSNDKNKQSKNNN